MSMSDKVIANLQNPIPILQEPSSNITTNPFIPYKQQIQEIEVLESEANKIMEKVFIENRSSIQNIKIKQIGENISISIIGFLNDLFVKPNDINWFTYLMNIFKKDNRYAYFGILFIIIGIIIWILKRK
jgi:hypothetical protein